MKTLKKALSVILGLAIMLSCVMGMQVSVLAEETTTESTETTNLVIEVGDATVSDGTVTVPVEITSNPGFRALGIEVSYDAAVLELTSATKNTTLFADKDSAACSETITTNPYVMQWAFAEIEADVTTTGTIATLTFNVKDATIGATYVSVEVTEAWDINKAAVATTAVPNEKVPVVEETTECDHDWTIASSTAAVGEKVEGDLAGTETQKGSITLTCEVCGQTEDPQEVSYYDDYRPNSINLDLAAEIKLNLYVTDARLEGAEEVFFVTSLMVQGDDPTVQVLSLEDAPDDTEKSRQIISTGIPSKFLTDQLVMNVFLKKDGVWYSGRTYSYSVVDAAHLKDGKTTKEEYQMYVALFDFGAKAQLYFNYKTDNLANSAENLGYFADYPLDVTEPVVEAQMTNNRGTQGVRFRAYDYNLDAKTILNLKFTVNEAETLPKAEDINVRFVHTDVYGDTYSYRYNIDQLEYEPDNDRYVVSMGELTSRQWRDSITAVVYNGDTAYDCSFVISIAGLMQYSIENGKAADDLVLAALYKSMINYGDYADAYFANA